MAGPSNKACPLGHLTFLSKRLSAVETKRFRNSLNQQVKAALTGHCSCQFHVGFSVVAVLYSYIVKYAFV